MNCRITDEALDTIFYRCRELRELRMNHCENKNYVISDCMFAKLPTYHPFDAPYFQQLRLIDFTGITSITDDALASLVKVAPKIRSLVLNKCDKITDQGVFMICKLGRYLHFLHLGHCVLLTDRAIIQLALSCVRIRYLDLACCCRITDRAISELANLPKLKRIGLVKCFQVTDESILAFAKSTRVPTTLERIHLSYCQQLSARAISQLLNACTKLNHLSLTNVHDFLRDDLKYFCRVPPKEFNAQQRTIFCVFSGNGVSELRVYLNSMYKNNPFQASA